ncbi:hypothetical protein D3C80_1860240 [compost metagenome]
MPVDDLMAGAVPGLFHFLRGLEVMPPDRHRNDEPEQEFKAGLQRDGMMTDRIHHHKDKFA